MKYYTIESHAEKEAPFGIAWQVKLFDEHTLLEEYDHIFYNEIAGYCKCLEDMGFIENVEVKIDIQKELEKLQKNIDDINNATSLVNRFGVGTFESHMKTISVDVPRSTRYTFFKKVNFKGGWVE